MYLLQLAASPHRFEQVDQFIFDNRKFVVDDEGNPRYTENYAVRDGGKVTIHMTNIDGQMVGGIDRILGFNGNLGQASEPTHVHIHKGRSRWLYEVATGSKYKKAA
ncbi:MAG: hypothetical protein DWQ19_12870 [Crenarchaeota archaeon]|nr:MAG: hypothetical protein DWQ19_12870 [Thermoproteota archaeon]